MIKKIISCFLLNSFLLLLPCYNIAKADSENNKEKINSKEQKEKVNYNNLIKTLVEATKVTITNKEKEINKKYYAYANIEIKKESNTQSETICKLALNQQIHVISLIDDWYKISWNNGIYYVNKKKLSENYIEEKIEKIYYANTNVNIREKNTIKSNVVYTLSPNQTIYIISLIDGWYKVSWQDKIAYVKKEYLSQEPIEIPIKKQLIDKAMSLLNIPYVWGATGPSSYDCSGFTQYVYTSLGIPIPRTSQEQYYCGNKIDINSLDIGDLLLFNTYTNYGHVGIYIGNNQFIHASSGQGKIVISSLSGYYIDKYAGAVRYLKY